MSIDENCRKSYLIFLIMLIERLVFTVSWLRFPLPQLSKKTLMKSVSRICRIFQLLPGMFQQNAPHILSWCICVSATLLLNPAFATAAETPSQRQNLTIFYSANNLGETDPGG
ncbi:MAG: hypothetical protein F9K32_03200 [Desulfobulbaceae bacterium]|nr:MAG: hypothetical protein F9K32_03200 [Desulfobulbaceae bacterium]